MQCYVDFKYNKQALKGIKRVRQTNHRSEKSNSGEGGNARHSQGEGAIICEFSNSSLKLRHLCELPRSTLFVLSLLTIACLDSSLSRSYFRYYNECILILDSDFIRALKVHLVFEFLGASVNVCLGLVYLLHLNFC